MKYAILADIHGNLAALQAVLRHAEGQGCDGYACLGDIVGGNREGLGQSAECVRLVRSRGMVCVKGNLEMYCAEDFPLDDFSPKARENILSVRAELSEEDREWLAGLPFTKVVSGFTLVHATLHEPSKWGYVFDKVEAEKNFLHQQTDVCFFGHTHVPVAFIRDSVVRGGTYTSFRVEKQKQYFINAGSAGEPRDNDRRAAYATYDLETSQVQLHRFEVCSPPTPPPAACATLS